MAANQDFTGQPFQIVTVILGLIASCQLLTTYKIHSEHAIMLRLSLEIRWYCWQNRVIFQKLLKINGDMPAYTLDELFL